MSRPVSRVGEVLDLFSLEQPEWSVSEVAKALGLPKSSVARTMSTLAEQGLLRRTGRSYRLGWRLVTLSQTLLRSTGFRAGARREMERLVSRFGDAVHLLALDGTRAVYLEKTLPAKPASASLTRIGFSIPAHSSASGKVLLAYRPREEGLDHLEERGIKSLTPNTIVAFEELTQELELVREKGYAYDHEETMPGLCCAAAPIRDHIGEVVAAMSFVVPAQRFERGREDRYGAAVVEAAHRVFENSGCSAAERLAEDRRSAARERTRS